MSLLDVLTLLSFIGLNVDILFQTRRVYKTKSSKDLSLIGLSVRYLAIIVILIKYVNVGDTTLLIGQSLILLTFTIYFMLVVSYFRYKKRLP